MRRSGRLLVLAFSTTVMACSSGTGSPGRGNGDAGGGTPEAAGPIDSPAAEGGGGSDDPVQRNLDDVNRYRATLRIAPLRLDTTLDAFALAGTKQESMDHSPHAHFIAAESSGAIWKDGFSMSAGENQGDPNGWYMLATDPTQNELDQIDAVQKTMFDEGPGDGEAHGHYENIMNPQFTRLGVGLLEVDGKLYLTNDFSAE